MLKCPTYPYLVKDFWVRVEVSDELATSMEENQMVLKDKSLKGKSRKEMGLKEFEEVEIKSVVMGVDVTITEKIISKLLSVSNTRRFILNTKETSHEVDVIKTRLFELSKDACSFSDFGKVKNMNTTYKLLFKILILYLIPREGNIDQISWD